MRGNVESNTQSGVGAIFAIYLLGLLLGGLYVGMISPVRLVIQQDFGLGDTAGIWMVNIYTLFYAACIPVIGKLADIRGPQAGLHRLLARVHGRLAYLRPVANV